MWVSWLFTRPIIFFLFSFQPVARLCRRTFSSIPHHLPCDQSLRWLLPPHSVHHPEWCRPTGHLGQTLLGFSPSRRQSRCPSVAQQPARPNMEFTWNRPPAGYKSFTRKLMCLDPYVIDFHHSFLFLLWLAESPPPSVWSDPRGKGAVSVVRDQGRAWEKWGLPVPAR